MSAIRSSLRFVAALAWVVLALTYVLRSSLVAGFADTDLERAERIWPGHPSVLSGRALLNVADSAVHSRGLDSDTKALAMEVARAEPLSPLPYLITGAEAQRSSNPAQAERLLMLARQRDPRAPAPRLLLAEQYISEGRIREGVPESAVLGRLLPGSAEPLSLAFARYIQTAGIPDGMEELMRSNADLSGRIMNELSSDAANADLLLKIAALAPPRAPGPAPGWQSRLISELVARGDYGRARFVWTKLAGGEADTSAPIQDAQFKGSFAPPPFNWTFASQGAVIEPQGGSLHIFYFGRDDATLATQLLMLRPGPYRLQMTLTGQLADPQAVRWKVSCLPAMSTILDRPIGQTGRLDLSLEVPAQGCGAQRMELDASASEIGRSSDFLISDLGLTARAKR